ncbi:hypothetical protein HPB48_026219 [Haemaphysalis longicornis]|uniref:Uncharacterized protein n=1 Tax=Haemaphysalis longicornis TaxID=44386 RepID=A0A9J6HAW3_HAELO|nr:hypothetical protein HPB48_026219 [Haemaphysalis longicornis]
MKTMRKELIVAQGQTLECQKENQRLNKELRDVQKQLIELNQYGRRNNIELKGVPSSKDEDLHKVVQNAAATLKVDMSIQDIDIVHTCTKQE